ncbi:MAG TPA: GAF domain-containing protein [bacterium]|nr:GAF domain-containing protein [bacterium]
MNEFNEVLQSVLFDITKLLQVDEKPEEIFTNILTLTRQIIPYERSTLYLYDSRTEKLEPVTNVGGEIDLISIFNFKMGKGLSGWTAQIKRPINLGNVRGSKKIEDGEIHSFLSVPLLVKEKLVGVLNCGHSRQNAFEENDLVKLQIIGGQIAGIIENVKSTVQIMQKNIELEELNKQLQETQDKLIRSEKMALIGQMAVKLSHEINNPLAIITGNLHLLENDLEEIKEVFEQSDITERFRIIDLQIQRIVSVLNKLLSLKEMDIEEYTADGVDMLKIEPNYD